MVKQRQSTALTPHIERIILLMKVEQVEIHI